MFDPEPDQGEHAKWILFEQEKKTVAKFGGTSETEQRWASHFDTCPAADGGGTHRQAASARRQEAGSDRRAPEASARRPEPAPARVAPQVAANRKSLTAVEVTVTFGDLIFSGTCTLVPNLKDEEAAEPASDRQPGDDDPDL